MRFKRSMRVGLLCLLGYLAQGRGSLCAGGTLYWDGDGTGASGNPPTSGVGGSGTWDTFTNDWWNGTGYTTWTGTSSGAPDVADFRGSGGTVAVSGTIYVNQMTTASSTGNYTFTGGILSFVGSSPTIVLKNGLTLDITSQIASSTGLSVGSANGFLILDNASNQIDGTINIGAGAAGGQGVGLLLFSADGSLGTVSTISVNTGSGVNNPIFGIKDVTNNNVTLSATRTLSLSGGGYLTLSTGGAGGEGNMLTINSKITGSGSIATTAGGANLNGGTIVIGNGTNDYTGATLLNRDTRMQLGSGGALPATTTLSIAGSASRYNNGGQFDLNGANQTVAGLYSTASNTTGNAANTSAPGNADFSGYGSNKYSSALTNTAASTTSTLTINGVANSRFDGVITDGNGKVAIALAKGGATAPTLTLTNVNAYTGSTSLSGGSTLTLDFQQFATSSGTALTNLISPASAVVFGTGGGTVIVNGRSTATATSLSNVTEPTTGNFTETATSTTGVVAGQVITGSNFNAGTFVVSVTDATHLVLSQTPINTNTPTSATLTAPSFTASQTFNAVTVNGAATIDVENNGGAGTTLAINSLSGAANLTQLGDGTLTISGTTSNNVWTGALTVSAGKTALGNALALNTSSHNNISLNATADFSTGGFSASAGTLALTGTGNAVIDMGTGNSVLQFDDSHSVSWSGTELDIMNWSGTPVNGGGTDQLFVGSDNTGLSSQQLSQIRFIDPAGFSGTYTAAQLATGEVVAIVPEPASTALVGAAAAGLLIRRRRANKP